MKYAWISVTPYDPRTTRESNPEEFVAAEHPGEYERRAGFGITKFVHGDTYEGVRGEVHIIVAALGGNVARTIDELALDGSDNEVIEIMQHNGAGTAYADTPQKLMPRNGETGLFLTVTPCRADGTNLHVFDASYFEPRGE